MPNTINVFIAMPFSPELRVAYDLIIKPACEEACTDEKSIIPWRGDDEFFSDTISKKAIEQMRTCDCFIADLTSLNLNVIFEIGYLHALNKEGICISHHTYNEESVPIYLKNFPTYHYDEDPEDFEKLKSNLINFLKEI